MRGGRECRASPRRHRYSASLMPCQKCSHDIPEKSWRQISIVVTIGAPQFAQIVARPDELVALTHDDPRTIVIKAELPLDGARNFHGRHCIPGRAMGHRQHRHQRFTVPTAFDCKCDDARAILATFFLSALRFVISEIRIRDHQARLGRRNCHAGVTSGQAACRDDRAGDPCVPIRPVPLLRRTTPP